MVLKVRRVITFGERGRGVIGGKPEGDVSRC